MGLGGTKAEPGRHVVARARIIVFPLFVVVAFLQPGAHVAGLVAVALLGAAFVGLTAWLTLKNSPRRPPTWLMLGGDLLLLTAATDLGDASRSMYAFVALLGLCAMPPLPRRRDRICFYAFFWCIVGVPVLADDVHGGGFPEHAASFTAALLIAYTFASRSGQLERRRRRRLDVLLDERSRLLTQAAQLTDANHQQISGKLHDGVLQHLLAARQDLDQAASRGDDEDLAHARALLRTAITTLRAAVTELHPVPLTGGRLPDALRTLVNQHRLDGAQLDAAIAADASGRNDDALYVLARELISDALTRSDGMAVSVRLFRDGDEVVFELTGTPSPADAPGTPPAVAWAAARVLDSGGTVDVGDARGRPLVSSARLPRSASDHPPASVGPSARAREAPGATILEEPVRSAR